MGASTAAAEKAAGLSAAKADGRWQPDAAYRPGDAPAARRSWSTCGSATPARRCRRSSRPCRSWPRSSTSRSRPSAGSSRAGRPARSLKIEPDSLPRADDLIPRLFPASTALTVDDQGASLITREPIPGLDLAGRRRALLGRSSCPRSSRRARPPTAPSAPTTSSRSPWRTTTSTPRPTPSRRRRSPTRTASRC